VPADSDDKATIFAIATIAACIAATAHEAAGHGTACLLLHGRITQLTSVYFRCSARSTWIAAAGPIGNLAAFALAWLALKGAPMQWPRTRLLLFLTMTINIFWFAGYLIYSALLNDGDMYFVANDLFGEPTIPLRAAGIAIGAACYWLGLMAMRPFTSRVLQEARQTRRLLWHSWLAASLSACVAGLAYAPDRLGATWQAALEIGAACLPMLSRTAIARPQGDAEAGPIQRGNFWISASLLVFALFVATLGRGMPQ
jgi:hypothetical protein